MNVETAMVELRLTKKTLDALVVISSRQNANLHNNADRMITLGIEETYRKYPNLRTGGCREKG